jgi:catechol 2,3-dioxygenase-like lactoylglutathione lyase family enzyme
MSGTHGNFIQVTPFLYVADLEAALKFFTDVLGFEVQFHDGKNFAYVHRETVGFRIWQRPAAEVPVGARRFAHYIDVRDVDALYAELKPRLDLLPEGDVHGPADKNYGQRELLVVGPDGDLIAFGQAMDRRDGAAE